LAATIRLPCMLSEAQSQEVRDNCSFDIIIPEKYDISPEPTPSHLELLRKEIDPTGMLIGK